MEIQPVGPLDIYAIRSVLSSSNITFTQKTDFIRKNQAEIKNVMETEISSSEFKGLMLARPLQKFRPLKNSFTKRGDKILLAKTLGIKPSEVDDYINNVKDDLKVVDDLNFLPQNKIDAIKTYIYRHGSKDGIVTFLDYELSSSKNIVKTLYTTLEYHTGGLADYFIRPIHRMSNTTMLQLYDVIDKNIESARAGGFISEEESNKIARWSLVAIYRIQNNSKFINAVKTYNVLNQ